MSIKSSRRQRLSRLSASVFKGGLKELRVWRKQDSTFPKNSKFPPDSETPSTAWVDLGSRIISNLQSDQTLLPQQASHDLSVAGNCLIQLIFFITIYLSHSDHNGEQSNLYSGFSENILLHCNFKIIYSIVSVATYLLRECVVNFS